MLSNYPFERSEAIPILGLWTRGGWYLYIEYLDLKKFTFHKWTLDSGRLILRATSSLMKMSGYLERQSLKSWAVDQYGLSNYSAHQLEVVIVCRGGVIILGIVGGFSNSDRVHRENQHSSSQRKGIPKKKRYMSSSQNVSRCVEYVHEFLENTGCIHTVLEKRQGQNTIFFCRDSWN